MPRPLQAGFTAGSNDPENFGRVAKIFIDNKANEAYIADGYLNHRVAVLDADTGKMKRWWGAYGNKPRRYAASAATRHGAADTSQQFRNPVHCADMSVDRLIYVCDRVNDRMQVFTPEGKFVKEMYYKTNTKTRRLGVGHRLLEGSAAEVHLHGGRRERACGDHRPPDADADLPPSATAAILPASSMACTRSPSTPRATCSPPKPMEAAASRSSSTRAWRPVTKMDQGVAWPKS